nr:DUF3265 domain-containing protein [Vibrio navarrensis]
MLFYKQLCIFRITRRLRGIHAAWHSWYAVVFGGESGLRKAPSVRIVVTVKI